MSHSEDPPPSPPAHPSDGSPPAPPDSAPAPARRFEIEGFDEARPPESGHLFAEPPPDPPLQPYEMLHEQKKTRQRTAPAAESLEARTLPATAPDAPLRLRLFWGTLPLALLLLGYASVIASQRGVGLAWDEAFYYEPSLRASEWMGSAVRGDWPFDAASIDRAWGAGARNEHPSIQKLLSGLSMRFFPDPQSQLYAMRLPMAVLFGLTLMFIYWIGRRAWGPAPALVAALIYATMPRVFGHAHFASMETPLLFFTVLLVFCFLRGLDSWPWSIAGGLVFGLLLATKINGFFLPIPLILWAHLYARRRYVNNLFAMLTLGPIVFVAAWPWLWPDPVARTLDYLRFHAAHQQTALYFLHRIWGYGRANGPWFYPLTMIGVTLPLVSLLLIVYGALRTLAQWTSRPLGALFLACAAVLLAVACLPSTPRYDGVRLFLPVFPFLALLGASGVVGLMHRVAKIAARRRPADEAREHAVRRWVVTIAGLLVLFEGLIAIARYHPYELSYFNPLVGGLAGAEKRGFEVTYWGETLNQDVVEAINRLPDGSKLKPLVFNELALELLQRWDLIKSEIRLGGQPPYDYHLLQMRRGMFARPERALVGSGRFPIVRQWLKFGVSLIAIYKTGPDFETFWLTLPPDSTIVRPPEESTAPRNFNNP